MFNLTDYIKKNLIGGFEDGTFTQSKIMQICIGYLSKGLLTEEDIESIDNSIAEIIAERERKLSEAVEYEEDTDIVDDGE